MRCSTKIANDRFGYRVTCCLGARRHGCPRRYFHHVFVSLNWGGFVSPSTAAKLQFLLRKGTVWPNIARMVLLRGGALRGPELLKYSGESNFDPSILIVAGGSQCFDPNLKTFTAEDHWLRCQLNLCWSTPNSLCTERLYFCFVATSQPSSVSCVATWTPCGRTHTKLVCCWAPFLISKSSCQARSDIRAMRTGHGHQCHRRLN